MDSTEAHPGCCSSVGAAAREGDSKSLQKLIANGSSINIHDNRGWTPLHEAAKANHSDCVRILLQCVEEDVNVITLEEETALLFAAQNGNKEMIEQLLVHGADPDICDMREIYPLHKAVEGNHKECVELLLKNSANVNHIDRNGWSSLHEAACRGFADILQILLESGAVTDVQDNYGYGITPVITAAQYGHLDCLKLLIEHGIDPNTTAADGATPLCVATRENYPECVEYLLELGASSAISVSTMSTDESLEMAPIHIAADKGHMRCLELLLPISLGLLQEDFIDFDEELNTPMHFAARKGHIEVVQALLKAGCDPDFGLSEDDEYVRNKRLGASKPVSLCAMWQRQFGVAKLLLDSGACVCNPQSGHCLVKDCEEDVPSLKFLLDLDADVGCPHMSVEKLTKNLKLASLLLKSGKRWSFDCSDGHGFCSQRWISYDTNRHRNGWLNMIKLVYNYVDRLRLCQHNISYIQDHIELNEVLKITGKPCSLYHLCRVAITEHLGTVRATKIIPKMDFLPKLVKDYLLYEDVPIPTTKRD